MGTVSRRVRRNPLAGAERIGIGAGAPGNLSLEVAPPSEKTGHPFRGQAVPPLRGKTQN